MRRWSRRLPLATALAAAQFVLLGAGRAQPALPVTSLSAVVESRSATRTLLKVVGLIGTFAKMVAGMRAPPPQALRAQSPSTPPAQVEGAPDNIMSPEFQARSGEIMNATLKVRTLTSTADELTDLRSFCAMPLGRKTIAAMLQLLQQGMRFGLACETRVAQDAFRKHREALRVPQPKSLTTWSPA